MSENESSDFEPWTNNHDNKITGVDFKSNEDENEDRSVTTRDTEASQLSMGENVSGCTAQETEVTSEVSNNQSVNDVNFQLRAASPSFCSDSTESSVVTDEGKRENSPATALKTDTVAEKSEEQQLGGVPATEDDPFIQSVKYLEKHQILRLFQNFAAKIVYNRPDNPFQYLVEELERSRGGLADTSTEGQDSNLLS